MTSGTRVRIERIACVAVDHRTVDHLTGKTGTVERVLDEPWLRVRIDRESVVRVFHRNHLVAL